MKLSDFTKLKGCMRLTESPVDAEALAALRKANELLRANGHTWESVFARLVKIDVPIESVLEPKDERLVIEEAFAAIEDADPRGSWADFVASVREQWDSRGYLTAPQREAILKGAARGKQ
jgi:predicted lipid carrier protein YhbT